MYPENRQTNPEDIMRHHHLHPSYALLLFLLGLLLAPYVLAIVAIFAVIWLVAFVIATLFFRS